MELASCGYFVVCLSHEDSSGCFAPRSGPFNPEADVKCEYKERNLQVKMRENEILSLAEEITHPEFLESICLDWKHNSLAGPLVLMGHSFGGISALGALFDCSEARACCVMDPWFKPHREDQLCQNEFQNTLIVMTERFRNYLKKDE